MSVSSGHEYLKEHEIGGAVLLLDVDKESSEVLAAAKAATVGHAARTLVKDGPLRSIILGFRAGAALHDHQAPGPVSIHVLSGEVNVTSTGRTDSLGSGRAIAFGSPVSHSVEARQDSVLLVTIAISNPD